MPVAGDIYYYASKGGTTAKPPVVFIHGAGGNYTHWPYYLRRMPGYRIFAVDLPGHGKSGGVGEQSIFVYAKIVFDWMQAIGIHQAVVVGQSMGGAIALALALEYGEHVLGLGLVGTGARLRVMPDFLDQLSKESTYGRGVNKLVELYFADSTGDVLRNKVSRQLRRTRPSVVHGDFVACDRFDVMDRLNEIKAPTSVICGSEDALTPPKYARHLAESIPNGNLTMIPKAGHMVALEQPEMVARTLETFLGNVAY